MQIKIIILCMFIRVDDVTYIETVWWFCARLLLQKINENML